MESYEVFRKMMFDRNIVKADVIRGSGVSRPTLLKWEKGEEPTLTTLRKIAKYFDCPVTDFIKG